MSRMKRQQSAKTDQATKNLQKAAPLILSSIAAFGGIWMAITGTTTLDKTHEAVRNDIPAELKDYEKKLNNDLPAEWKSFYTDQANLAVAYEAIRKKYETVEKNIDEHPELVDKLFKQLDETQLALDNKSIQEIRDQQGVFYRANKEYLQKAYGGIGSSTKIQGVDSSVAQNWLRVANALTETAKSVEKEDVTQKNEAFFGRIRELRTTNPKEAVRQAAEVSMAFEAHQVLREKTDNLTRRFKILTDKENGYKSKIGEANQENAVQQAKGIGGEPLLYGGIALTAAGVAGAVASAMNFREK